MLELINESVQGGNDIESHEYELKKISETIELLKRRINAIQELANTDGSPMTVSIKSGRLSRSENKKDYNMTIPSSAR